MKKFLDWFYSGHIGRLILLGSSATTSLSFIYWIFSRSGAAIMTSFAAATIMIVYMVFAIAYVNKPLRS